MVGGHTHTHLSSESYRAASSIQTYMQSNDEMQISNQTTLPLTMDKIGSSEAAYMQNAVPGAELLLVQVIHRHGDRSPITPSEQQPRLRQTLSRPHTLLRTRLCCAVGVQLA